MRKGERQRQTDRKTKSREEMIGTWQGWGREERETEGEEERETETDRQKDKEEEEMIGTS